MADILVLGKEGQLATALAALLGRRALVLGPQEADFLAVDFIAQLERGVGDAPIRAVINAAAYTAVDKAEGEGRDAAFRLNSTAVGELAQWCAKHHLPLVHISTDYVYDGSAYQPRKEDAPVSPINAYGQSKLAGEQAVQQAGGDYLILRTSWLYDAHGKNFLNTMLRLFGEKEQLTVIDDQVGAPTYVPHLARSMVDMLERARAMQPFPSGIYHLCSGGATSWHGFAKAIFALDTAGKFGHTRPVICREIKPIPTSAYPLPALRPLNSQLDCSKVKQAFGIAMPNWEEGLNACAQEKKESHAGR